MGNCIERSNKNIPAVDEEDHELTTTNEKEERNGMRIKIVLSKEELEWLVSELENKQGKKVEHILDDIQRNRSAEGNKKKLIGLHNINVVNWKPSLGSIDEISMPESS